ncbi:MAG: hypothetical protein FVQ79_14245 [Planctomycetes bacterium]|nr:hypothetical protein [Planctomycetota bacterium]
MSRHCTACGSKEVEKINQLLIVGVSIREITQRYRLSKDAIFRHKKNHIPELLAKAEKGEILKANKIIEEIERIYNRVNKLFNACDRYLQDPDNPDQYDLGPRAEDITVIYFRFDENTGKMKRDKAKLSRLLEMLSKQGVKVVSWRYRHADPRELILKTQDRLQAQLELLSKLSGSLREAPQVNVTQIVAQVNNYLDEGAKAQLREKLKEIYEQG